MENPSTSELFPILMYGTLGMLVLIAGIILFVVVYQKRMIAQKARLQELELSYQRDLLSATIQSDEAARKRIAQDLHDDIGSLLATVKMSMGRIQRKLPTEFSHMETFKETQTMVHDSLDKVRSISRELLPTTLERFGLGAALTEYAKRITDTAGIEVQIHDQSQRQRMMLSKELGLYRVMQELTSNTLKHAEAARIDIDFQFEEGEARLNYQDHGKGFDGAAVKQSGSLGLGFKNMESRLQLIGGTWEWESKLGEGMQVDIRVPVDK